MESNGAPLGPRDEERTEPFFTPLSSNFINTSSLKHFRPLITFSLHVLLKCVYAGLGELLQVGPGRAPAVPKETDHLLPFWVTTVLITVS